MVYTWYISFFLSEYTIFNNGIFHFYTWYIPFLYLSYTIYVASIYLVYTNLMNIIFNS